MWTEEKGQLRCCFTVYLFVADEPACSPLSLGKPVLIPKKKPRVKTTNKPTFVKGAPTVPELCLNDM